MKNEEKIRKRRKIGDRVGGKGGRMGEESRRAKV